MARILIQVTIIIILTGAGAQYSYSDNREHEKQPGQATAEGAIRSVALTSTGPSFKEVKYENCSSSDADYARAFPGEPKFETISEMIDIEGNRNVTFKVKDAESRTRDGGGTAYTVNFGKPHFESEEVTVWKGKAEIVDQYDERVVRNITYIEQKGFPGRKVYTIQTLVDPRDMFFGNEGAKGPGTYYGMSIFDNMGNYASLGSEVDSSAPSQKIYKVHLHCENKKNGDLWGFNSGNLLGNVEDPPLIKGLNPEDVPTRSLNPGRQGSGPIARSLLNEPERQTQLANEILADADNLSPARKRFANSLLDGSYKENPLWKLKNIILGDVKFIAPLKKEKISGEGVNPVSEKESESPVIGISRILEGAEVIDISDRSKIDPALRKALEGLDLQKQDGGRLQRQP